MPAQNTLSNALRDLADDVAYHVGSLLQVTFDLACILALGAALYAASLDGNRPASDMTADAAPMGPTRPAARQGPCLQGLDGAGLCITAATLDDSIGT